MTTSAGEYEMPSPATRPEDDPYSVGREERLALPAQAGGGEVFNIATAHDELIGAGWALYSSGIYISPDGHLFRGPARAWHVMKGIPMPHDGGSR